MTTTEQTLREALQQAQDELMSVLDSCNAERSHHDGDEFHERLNFIREALALPPAHVQTPVAMTDLDIDLLASTHTRSVTHPTRYVTDTTAFARAIESRVNAMWADRLRAVQGEPVAWRLKKSVETCGLQKFMTQGKYEKQTQVIKQWYEPYRCAECDTHPAVVPEDVRKDAERLNWLDSEANDLRAAPLGEDDYEWVVIAHHMAEPKERELGRGKTTRAAIDAAITAAQAQEGGEGGEG